MDKKDVYQRHDRTASTPEQSVRYQGSGEPAPTEADSDGIAIAIECLEHALPGMLSLRTAEHPSGVEEGLETKSGISRVCDYIRATDKPKTREDSLRWVCPRLEPDALQASKPASAEGASVTKGSLGRLLSDDGQAVLLEAVLDHLPAGTLLRLSEVCKNAGLVISKSTRAQLKLRKLFHAVGPYDILRSDTAPTGLQLSWLLEREYRTEKLLSHVNTIINGSDMLYGQIDGGYLLSHFHIERKTDDVSSLAQGIAEDKSSPRSGRLAVIFDTNTEEESKTDQDGRSRAGWAYALDTRLAETAISAKDDLMVRVRMHTLIGPPNDPHEAIWLLEFCRMKPTDPTRSLRNVSKPEYHPRARLPYLGLLMPTFGQIGAVKLDLKLGPDGLLLFSCYHVNEQTRQVSVILDWIKGEARGYIDTDHEDATSLSHAFVNGEHLISAVSGVSRKRSYETDALGEQGGVGVSVPGTWAALWLWSVPQQGRRSEDLLARYKLADAAGGRSSTPVIPWNHIERLAPQVSFDLPPMSDFEQSAMAHTRQAFRLRCAKIETTRSSADGLSVNGNLALFTFMGDMQHRLFRANVRPMQFSGVVQAAKLVDAWQRAQAAEERNVSGFARARRIAQCKELHVPLDTIAWRDWQQWAHVFTLNSHLKPVLHGTKLVVGYCPREEQEAFAPSVPIDRMRMRGVPFTQFKFAIRDFNTNRLAHPRFRPWHKFGLPSDHPSQSQDLDPVVAGCSADIMTFDSHSVTRGPPCSTRGMFLDKIIRGGLKYNEVVAKTDVNTEVKLAKLRNGGQAVREARPEFVAGICYDGETLLVRMSEVAWCLQLGPRRGAIEPCCKSLKDQREARMASSDSIPH